MKNFRENEPRAIASENVSSRFPVRKSELDRFKLGKKCYKQVARDQKREKLLCLDVGSGHKPFPKADVLCDLNVRETPDRRMQRLVTNMKPFVECDCAFLPFKDGAFDFVTSYYLVEHISNPGSFFKELKRVSRHGYIQCPSWFSEILYGEEVHAWTLTKRNGKLFAKPINRETFRLRLGFVFQRLYQSSTWRVFHAILDETLHLFTVCYQF
jgi:SAM-dependent methyltransferase